MPLQDTYSFLGSRGVHDTIVRPRVGKNEATGVKFGMFLKNFYGSDLKSNTFRVDIVMSLKWIDPRVIKWVPEGLERVVLSDSQAINKIWIPDIVVTNHELGGLQVISTSVEVYKSGVVSKVERAQVRASNLFDLESYPFDEQDLDIKIASAKYMSADLVLSPMSNKDSSGINDDIFGGSYDIKSFQTSVDEEEDGDLVKSRGILSVKVVRKLDKYTQDHLVPTGILLMVSWAVFYFPFAGPFITPRLVLSVMTLLTFTNLMVKSASLLPGAAPFNWNDLFNQLVQCLMFVTIVVNIGSEICFHQFKVETLSRKVNHEAKVLLPVLSTFCIALILTSGGYRLMSLRTCAALTQLIVVVCLGSYVYWTVKRYPAEKVKSEALQKEMKMLGAAGAGFAMAGAADAAADAGADAGDAGGF